MTATIDSNDYRMTFTGILNADGSFWTPLAFDGEERARQHVRDFWGRNTSSAERCLRLFKFVPVRIQLTQVDPASGIKARSDETRSGSAEGESPAPKEDAR